MVAVVAIESLVGGVVAVTGSSVECGAVCGSCGAVFEMLVLSRRALRRCRRRCAGLRVLFVYVEGGESMMVGWSIVGTIGSVGAITLGSGGMLSGACCGSNPGGTGIG